MRCALAIPLIFLLGACHSSTMKPTELAGSWRATEISRGDSLAPLGIPYRATIEKASGENLLELTLVGCSVENFVYRIDGAHLVNSCGAPGTVVCTNNLMGCAIPRTDLDGSIPKHEEKCTDKLPYCTTRIRQDDERLIRLLRTASSWRYSQPNLVLFSASENAQVSLERDDR